MVGSMQRLHSLRFIHSEVLSTTSSLLLKTSLQMMTSKETHAKPENSALQKSADVVAKGVFKSDKGEYNCCLIFPNVNEEMKMIMMRVEA